LPSGILAAQGRDAGDHTLEAIEQRAIFEALSHTGGRQDKAAVRLGISRRTLIRKLKLYSAPPVCEANEVLAL
jgi:DNA-binding NtrC family response regulator